MSDLEQSARELKSEFALELCQWKLAAQAVKDLIETRKGMFGGRVGEALAKALEHAEDRAATYSLHLHNAEKKFPLD